MKFGMFVLPSWPQQDPSHQGRLYHEMIEQIQYAEELGFESVWLAEHHFTRFGIVPSALPLATYVAGVTKKIRIGTGVSVLNFHDPVFMAEETAMLDLLSNGRLDFGIGRGQVVYEYANFKVDYATRTQRFNEIVDIILGLWSTPGFTYHGEHYKVDDLTIAPNPIQKPHPPLYFAVSRTPGTIEDAVSRGLPMLTSANTPDEDVLGLRELYAAKCAEKGVEPQWDNMPFFRVTYVGEDQKTAEEDTRAAMDWVADLNGYRRTLTGGSEIYADIDKWIKTRPEEPPTFESRLKSTAKIGTPDKVVEAIKNLRDNHNVEYYTAHFSYGNMEHEKVMRSMKLFAEEVMPKFK